MNAAELDEAIRTAPEDVRAELARPFHPLRTVKNPTYVGKWDDQPDEEEEPEEEEADEQSDEGPDDDEIQTKRVPGGIADNVPDAELVRDIGQAADVLARVLVFLAGAKNGQALLNRAVSLLVAVRVDLVGGSAKEAAKRFGLSKQGLSQGIKRMTKSLCTHTAR